MGQHRSSTSRLDIARKEEELGRELMRGRKERKEGGRERKKGRAAKEG